MKTILFATTLTLALITGCADKESAATIRKLEERIAALEEGREQYRQDTSAILNRAVVAMDTGLGVITNQLQTTLDNYEGRIAANIRNEVGLEVGRQIQQIRKAPPAAAAAVLKNGVPAPVYDQIEAEAARKWPTNFEMQEYTIRNQIEAWQKLRAAR